MSVTPMADGYRENPPGIFFDPLFNWLEHAMPPRTNEDVLGDIYCFPVGLSVFVPLYIVAQS